MEDKINKINYINGISPGIARRIARYTFGKNFEFMRIEVDERRYIFFLKEEDPIRQRHFTNFWGANWITRII